MGIYKSGFITLVGRTNVGKSTFMNRVLGEQVAITSPKPQTTRNKITGIYTTDVAQIIFVDTPGIHCLRAEKKRLNIRMVGTAYKSISDVDLVVLVCEPTAQVPVDEEELLEHLRGLNIPLIVAINKIDTVKKPTLLNIIDTYKNQLPNACAFVPISATMGDGVDDLLNTMIEYLPTGQALFPEDQVSEQPERFFAAEVIRAQIYRLTGEEIPYSCAVVVESFKEKSESLLVIEASIVVERDSQKGIVIGKRGSMLKKIGTAARQDLERMLGTKVFLELFVKVRPDWTKDDRALDDLGYL